MNKNTKQLMYKCEDKLDDSATTMIIAIRNRFVWDFTPLSTSLSYITTFPTQLTSITTQFIHTPASQS